jgi:hypothetical protein
MLGFEQMLFSDLLREENAKLHRLVANLTLDKHMLGEIVRKTL